MAVEHSAEARGQLGAMLRRRILLLIALLILGIGAGVGAGVLLPAEYSATASVLVEPLEGNPYSPQGRSDDLINLETEAQLVQTDAVAELAHQRLKSTNIETLRSHVSASVPPNTQILNISYRASSPEAAESGARTFAEAYLRYRQQRAQAVIDGKLKKLDEQATKVQENMREANRQRATATGAQRALLGQRITAFANQLGVIDEQKNDVSSTPVSPGQVINPAAASEGAEAKRIAVFGVGGLVLGAALALAVMLLRERLDRRLRTSEQVEAMGLRVLSIVPPGRSGELALTDRARTPAGEAYRRLRSGIVAHISATPLTMLVAAATPGTTASMTGTNLAVALAYAGSDTILVDATADEPDPAAAFGLPPGKGLSEILLKGTDPASLLIHADSQLRLLPRGGSPTAAAHRFSGPRMRDAVDTLRDRADFVLLVAPDVHDADTQALCTLADTVLLVVHIGVTTREDLQQAYAEVVHAGSTVLGVVIESPSASAGRAPVRHAAQRPQTTARAADRGRSGPPAEWGKPVAPVDGTRRQTEDRARSSRRAKPPRSKGQPPVDESDTNTTVTLPALPTVPPKTGSAKTTPPKSPSSREGSSQDDSSGSDSSQKNPFQGGVSGQGKLAPPANGADGQHHGSGMLTSRRSTSAQRKSIRGSRGSSQHFGSDHLVGSADEEDTTRTRDDFHL